MNNIPNSVIAKLSGHIRDMKDGKIYGRRHSDPRSFTVSKYLRDVYAGYSTVHTLVSYEDYIGLLISQGCLDKSQSSLVYEDMDYQPQPLSECTEVY